MKDLLFLVLMIAAICCLHATSNKQLTPNDMKLQEPRVPVYNAAWPGALPENLGSRSVYRMGNKKHNPEHNKPLYRE